MLRDLGLLSVVVPLYNEEETLPLLYGRVTSALEGLEFELVLVDDGSKDATSHLMAELAERDPRVKAVFLSRNFGHQPALTAGLDHARGDVVVSMDGDLQDPPELIRNMVEEWRAGADVVYALRRRRAGERAWKLATTSWFYRIFRRVTHVQLDNSGDFRLVDRRVLDVLLAMPERNRFLRGLTVWVGFRQAAVPYDRDPRAAGVSKYPISRLIRLSFDAIVSFSNAPLQAATLLGFCVSLFAFICIPLTAIARIYDLFVPGVSSTLIAILLLGGIQLITVGVIGEYVGRIYDEVKRRPLYVVRDALNTTNAEDPIHAEPQAVAVSAVG